MYFTKELLEQSKELTKKWEDEVRKIVSTVPDQKTRWSTVSDLEIKRLYTPEDIRDMDFVRDIGYRVSRCSGTEGTCHYRQGCGREPWIGQDGCHGR